MHKNIKNINHRLVDGEYGRELHTTVTIKKPTKSDLAVIKRMDRLQDSMLEQAKGLELYQTGKGVQYTQTGVVLESMSAYITKSVETGLPLTTLTHELLDISSDINDYINELKNGGELC